MDASATILTASMIQSNRLKEHYMDLDKTKRECELIVNRYNRDPEYAHVHEDSHVFETLNSLVIALESTELLKTATKLSR
jgi:hypothetical protein